MDSAPPPAVVLQQALQKYRKKELAGLLELDPRTIARWETGQQIQRRDVLAMLYLINRPTVRPPRHCDFTFVDLFAGIGEMRLGFEAVGGECLFTCEWDKNSQKTYRENFPDDSHEIFGDIREITERKKFALIPPHDVLLAGFPCQPFSIAGVSKKTALGHAHGFACEAQGTLFFELAKIIKYHQPHAFLLENVKNLRSHDKGKTFKVIMDVLEKQLGYRVFTKTIDAKGFVPQHRERVFLVGFRDHEIPFSWDAVKVPAPNAKTLASILHGIRGDEPIEPVYQEKDGRALKKYTLTKHLWSYLKAYAEKHRLLGNGFQYGLVTADQTSRTLSARYFKDGSEILISQGVRKNPRRLTPRECARLMGFDSENRVFRIPVSDTQAYRQFGNAVVVPVVRAVAEAMKPGILQAKEVALVGTRQPDMFVHG